MDSLRSDPRFQNLMRRLHFPPSSRSAGRNTGKNACATSTTIDLIIMGLSAGEKLGPYEILAPIGKGGMGEVYKARDTRLHREVAVKVLPQSFATEAARERFQREARAASALNHPNICAVYDVGESEGHPFLVMELLDGKTLREHIGGKPLDIPAALALSIEVADALDVAHAKASFIAISSQPTCLSPNAVTPRCSTSA